VSLFKKKTFKRGHIAKFVFQSLPRCILTLIIAGYVGELAAITVALKEQ
jgi:hypothetical protein